MPDRGLGLTWDRDADGRIERMRLPDGNTVEYSYDAAGDLETVTDPIGATTDFTYDGHRLVAYEDTGDPPIAEMAYDPDGRLISQTDPSGVLVETASDPTGWTETLTGPDPGLVTTLQFDVDGRVVEVEQSYDTTVYVGGRRTSADVVTDSETRSVQLRVRRGRQRRRGHLPERRRRDLRLRRPGPGHRLHRRRRRALRVAVHRRRRPRGLPHRRRDRRQLRLRRRRQPAARLLPDGHGARDLHLHRLGGVKTWEDADGVGGSVDYWARVSVGSGGWQVSDDPDDNVFPYQITSGSNTYTLHYDLNGAITGWTDSNGATTGVDDDPAAGELTLVDPNGHEQTYLWNQAGDWVGYRDKAGEENVFTYDDAHRIDTETTRNDDVLDFDWAHGRLVGITADDVWVTFSYDGLGRLVQVANAEQCIDITWTADGDLDTITSDGWATGERTLVYDWTDAGRYAGVDAELGVMAQTWDGFGRPESVIDDFTGTATFAWDADWRLDTLTRSSGLVTEYGTTLGGRIESIRTTAADGSVVEDTAYVWDATGRIDSITDLDGLHDYDWDDVGQLLAADHPAASGIPDEAYDYDPLGNRRSWEGHGVADVAHDAEDALIADAGFTYAYDAEGRLESRTATGSGELTTYHWDSFDQLVRIAYEDGTETTFAYDGLGRRIEVDHRGDVRRFVWDLDEVRAVLDENDELLTWHTTDPWGFLLAEWDAVAETADDALSNHLMTVTGLVDGDGNLQQVRRDSFGNGGSGGFDAFALTWHSQDPTGLIYARGRYLDPATGRFISEDPLAAANLYGYAGNDPLTAWDPYGLSTATEYGKLSEKTGHPTREGSTRVGMQVACTLASDASAIELITGIRCFRGSWTWGACSRASGSRRCVACASRRGRRWRRRKGRWRSSCSSAGTWCSRRRRRPGSGRSSGRSLGGRSQRWTRDVQVLGTAGRGAAGAGGAWGTLRLRGWGVRAVRGSRGRRDPVDRGGGRAGGRHDDPAGACGGGDRDRDSRTAGRR